MTLDLYLLEHRMHSSGLRTAGVILALAVASLSACNDHLDHTDPNPPAPVTIADLQLNATTVTIGGPFVPYTAILQNQLDSSIAGVSLQGRIHQGTTSRAAGGASIVCGNGANVGVLPNGTCATIYGFSVSNTTVGVGILQPGNAILEVQMHDAEGNILDTHDVTISLVTP